MVGVILGLVLKKEVARIILIILCVLFRVIVNHFSTIISQIQHIFLLLGVFYLFFLMLNSLFLFSFKPLLLQHPSRIFFFILFLQKLLILPQFLLLLLDFHLFQKLLLLLQLILLFIKLYLLFFLRFVIRIVWLTRVNSKRYRTSDYFKAFDSFDC